MSVQTIFTFRTDWDGNLSGNVMTVWTCISKWSLNGLHIPGESSTTLYMVLNHVPGTRHDVYSHRKNE